MFGRISLTLKSPTPMVPPSTVTVAVVSIRSSSVSNASGPAVRPWVVWSFYAMVTSGESPLTATRNETA